MLLKRCFSYYTELGLSPKATQKEIKEAFYRLSKLHHPDRVPKSTEFQKIAQAYEVLGSVSARKEYDEKMGFNQSKPFIYEGGKKTLEMPLLRNSYNWDTEKIRNERLKVAEQHKADQKDQRYDSLFRNTFVAIVSITGLILILTDNFL